MKSSSTRNDEEPSGGGWFPVEFQLERLSLATINRFIRFESPKPAQIKTMGLIPDPIEYEFIGELYRSIKAGIQRLSVTYEQDPRRTLFVGRPSFEADDDWKRLPMFRVDSTEAAMAAIDYIIAQGEGVSKLGPQSHYSSFVKILDEYQTLLAKDPTFDPARKLIANPITVKHRQAAAGTLIENETTREVAGLFNHVYMTVLMLLVQFFNPAGESRNQRISLQAASRRIMSGAVRPLAEILTLLAATTDLSGPVAGAPFEIYGDLGLPAFVDARSRVLLERISEAAETAHGLAESTRMARLEFVAENLDYLSANIRTVFGVASAED